MFKKKEIGVLALISLIIGFLLSFKELNDYSLEVLKTYLRNTGFALITVLISMTIAKLAAYRFGCDAEFRLWTIDRLGFHHAAHLEKPLPAWILFHLGFVFLSLGYIKWLALYVFDVSNVSRELKGR